ncbi:hypothetical protein LWI28_009496 [Acer negundo]|uniref:Uncharacterized protein n=1 Tax=Acer negundo TaxID=4023 RepID=A0AAD5IZD1_ACENE|nr:hypothetical protein LWI28_009496 [Acer negundo]
MAEGRVVGESSNKEVGNNKIKGNVLKKVTIHVSCFSPMDGAYRDVNISLKPLDMANDYLAPSGQAVAMSGDSVCHITKTLSVPSPIEDKFEIVASELEKAMVVIS